MKEFSIGAILLGGGFIIVVLALVLPIWLYQNARVYFAEQSGRAQLAEAEYSKRVAVETAKAKRDSAALEGEAEVARAHGLAEANNIIGDSLKGKEEYLRYLYITHLSEGEHKEVIYIPTEAGLPILEANPNR